MTTLWMTLALPWVIAIGVLLASLRWLLAMHRRANGLHWRTWRYAALVCGQVASAALLLMLLRTPDPGDEVRHLHVLTAHSPTSNSITATPGERWLRLPEAPEQARGEAIPDLATALRRHPNVRSLSVIGNGLEPRDRDSVAGLRIDFKPAPLPHGIVEWWVPPSLLPGNVLHVRGHARAPQGSQLELLDPAGRRVDLQPLPETGEFTLQAQVRGPGIAEHRLRLRSADGNTLDAARLPVQVAAGVPARLLLRSGGPDPDLKYLRRWATDSGASLRATIELGGGMQAGDPPIALDQSNLADTDLLILDDRSWSALDSSRRASVLAAVADGMGLLLRVAAPLADSTVLGLQVRAANLPPSYRPVVQGAQTQVPPMLSRPQLRIDNPGGRTLLRDNRGIPLSSWRPHGRGRIAVWLTGDSFLLALSGHSALHASQWANVLNATARPRLSGTGQIPLDARVGIRSELCGLSENAKLIAPDLTSTRLAIDPRTGSRQCAAFWPQISGWHRVTGTAVERAFLVRGNKDDMVSRAAATQSATAVLAARSMSTTVRSAEPSPAWPRWLLFLVWLAATGGLWWFERSRYGRVSS